MKLYLKPILLAGGGLIPEDPEDSLGDNSMTSGDKGGTVGDGGNRSVSRSLFSTVDNVIDTMAIEDPVIDVAPEVEFDVPEVVPEIEIPAVDIPLG